MKKYIFAVAGIMMLAGSLVASAEISGSGSAGAGSGVSGPGIVSEPSPTIYPAPVPVPPPTTGDSGFLQLNNLRVESVAAQTVPAEIVATLGYPTVMPMMGASGAGTAPFNPTCYKYESESDNTGTAVACPALPATSTSNGQTAPGSATASPPNFMYRPYHIEVDASTRLFLRDRSQGTLTDFSAGDTINVFGYYNSDGSIQAYLVRDLSKPAQTETIQLENLTLVSVSAITPPATLAATQTQTAPCYGFNEKDSKAIRVCPLGISSFSANAATQNVEPPAAMMPNWAMLRKYAVNVSAQTIILDRNRTKLTLADLQPGDAMNVYGGTSDNGQTIDADIIRDVSLPPAPTTMSGTVTQVNADGSFTIQTNDGRTLIVENPIRAGATVTLTGVLDTLKNILSEVSQIYFGNGNNAGVGVGGSGGGTFPPVSGVRRAGPINGGTMPTAAPVQPNTE